MRGPLLALLAASSFAAQAQEPLFLRIRPADTSIDDAARMRSLREAVWQRAEQRSRLAIASVCAGCLRPDRGVSDPAPNISAPLRDVGDHAVDGAVTNIVLARPPEVMP